MTLDAGKKLQEDLDRRVFSLLDRGLKIAKEVMGRRDKMPIPLSQEEAETLALALMQACAPEVEGDNLVGAVLPNANDPGKQVGGRHYAGRFQHWDAVVLFGLDYFQGQITKYVFRWRDKNGVQDLEKAQHFLTKYIEEIKAERIVAEPKRKLYT